MDRGEPVKTQICLKTNNTNCVKNRRVHTVFLQGSGHVRSGQLLLSYLQIKYILFERENTAYNQKEEIKKSQKIIRVIWSKDQIRKNPIDYINTTQLAALIN